MIDWFKNLLPVPMAAPESMQLRKARRRIIFALGFVACIVWAWKPLHAAIGFPIVAVLVGVLGMLAVQVPIWLMVKAQTDDAWLTDAIERTNAKEAAKDA